MVGQAFNEKDEGFKIQNRGKSRISDVLKSYGVVITANAISRNIITAYAKIAKPRDGETTIRQSILCSPPALVETFIYLNLV